MTRAFRIASTMTERLLSTITIFAALFAASDPEPIAIPRSAARSAGTSFTPSPVTVTISPCSCRVFTTRYLCSGRIRASTVVLFQRSSELVIVHALNIKAGRAAGRPLSRYARTGQPPVP